MSLYCPLPLPSKTMATGVDKSHTPNVSSCFFPTNDNVSKRSDRSTILSILNDSINISASTPKNNTMSDASLSPTMRSRGTLGEFSFVSDIQSTAATEIDPNTGWTMEKKLQRCRESRKRLENRFQKERKLRKACEEERDHVLNFVKGLLFGLEQEEEKAPIQSNSNHSGMSNSGCTLSLVRDFLSKYQDKDKGDNQSQQEHQLDISFNDQSITGHYSDDMESFYSDDMEEFYYDEIAMPSSDEESDEEENDSAHKFRMEFNVSQDNNDRWEEINSPEPDELESPSEYSSDSSYHSEAEDDFSELPVKFKSLNELKGSFHQFKPHSEAEDDFPKLPVRFKSPNERKGAFYKFKPTTEDEYDNSIRSIESTPLDTSINSLNSASVENSINSIVQERESKYTQEIENLKKEIERLEYQLKKAKMEHLEELDRLEQESDKREDLLDRSLNYAERLEAKSQKKSEDLKIKKDLLEKQAKDHSKKIEALQKKKRRELSKQKKELNSSHASELQKLEEKHREELAQLRVKIVDEIKPKLSQELKSLSKSHKQKVEELRATIAKLQQDTSQKDNALEKVQSSLTDQKSKIQDLLKGHAKKRNELRKLRLSLDSPREIPKVDSTTRSLDRPPHSPSERTIAKLESSLRKRKAQVKELQEEHATAMKQLESKLADAEKRHAEEISTLLKSMEANNTSNHEARNSDAAQMQALREQLEAIEQDHIHELKTVLDQKDDAIVDMEANYERELQAVQTVLEDNEHKHAKDITQLVNKMNVLHMMLKDPNERNTSLKSVDDEGSFLGHDISIPFKSASQQSRLLEEYVKSKEKQQKASNFFSPLAHAAIQTVSPSSHQRIVKALELDSTQTTVLSTPCSSYCSDDEMSDVSSLSDGSAFTAPISMIGEWKNFMQKANERPGTPDTEASDILSSTSHAVARVMQQQQVPVSVLNLQLPLTQQ